MLKSRISSWMVLLTLALAIVFSFSDAFISGIPTSQHVKSRDYFSGILRMRAEGVDELYYTDDSSFFSFFSTYIGERQVCLSSDLGDSAPVSWILDYACPPNKLEDSKPIPSSPDYINIRYSYPCYTYENCIFVCDKYWKESNRIVAFKSDDRIVFCSYEEYVDMSDNKEEYIRIESSEDVFDYLNRQVPSRNRRFLQSIIILAIQSAGAVCAAVLLKGRYKFLSLAISFPLGSAFMCMVLLILDLIGVSFGVLSISIAYATLLIIPLIIAKKEVISYLDIKAFIVFSLISISSLLVLSQLKMNYSSFDSIVKVLLGRRLATYNKLSDSFSFAIQFGLYEVILHGLSNLFGIEVFNLLYPYMSLICIITMFVATYYFTNNHARILALITTGIGVLVLITNCDYYVLSFWILSNGIMAVYAYILIICTLFCWKDDIDFSAVVFLSAFVIVTTRLEGAMVVSMIMFLVLLFNKKNAYLIKTITICELMIIAWNLVLISVTGYISDRVFWTTLKGIALIIVALGVLFSTFVSSRISFSTTSFWNRRYFLICIFSMAVTVILSIVKKDYFIENWETYINHIIGKSYFSNASHLWIIVLMSFVISAFQANELKKFTISVVIIYILVVFDLMLFRTGFPLHPNFTDSSRRMLVLIMPFAVWSCMLGMGEELSAIIKNKGAIINPM